jgi:hypothetical protein
VENGYSVALNEENKERKECLGLSYFRKAVCSLLFFIGFTFYYKINRHYKT